LPGWLIAAPAMSRRHLGNGRRCGKDFRGIAGPRRVDALAIDHPLRRFCRRAGNRDAAVPPFGIERSSRAEVEAGHVIPYVEREHFRPDEITDYVMAGDAPHRPRVLA
jgi:hypothetical protein